MRQRTLKFIEEGGTISKAARIFDVTRDSIYRWKKLKETKGRPVDDPPQRTFKKLDPDALKSYVEAHPHEMRKTYAAHFNVDPKAISKAFLRLKITRKKRLYSTKNETKTNAKCFWKT